MIYPEIRTYRQERDKEYLEEHPTEKWRCDLYPSPGLDFHGVGRTEAEAIFNAALAYRHYSGEEKSTGG